MAKKRKQDEKTYKSSVFDNPVMRVVIVIAVSFFILSIFGGTALYQLIGDAIRKGTTSTENAYVLVNDDEIFVTKDPQTNKTVLTQEAYNGVVLPIARIKQSEYFQSLEMVSYYETFVTNQFNQGLENLVLNDMYKQIANRVDLTIDPQAFSYYAEKDYIKLVDKLSDPDNEEAQNQYLPKNEIVHEQNLRKEYRRFNVEKPVEEGILISKLDIKHKFNIEDSEGKIKYAFFTFDDFIDKNLSKMEIKEEELKEFLEQNETLEITTGLRVDILAFDTEAKAEEASKHETPFEAKEYKNNLINDIFVEAESENYSDLVDLNLGQWKRAALSFGDKYALFKIKEKIRSKEYQEIVDAGVLKELQKEYVKKKSEEEGNTYVSDYKATAEKLMSELREKIENGSNMIKEAENLGLSIYGETGYFTLSEKKLEPAYENMPSKEKTKHIEALKKAKEYENFIYNVLTLDKGGISDVYNTSYKTEEDKQLGLLDKEDYYYIVQLVEVKLAEELVEARESSIAESLQKEYENDFKELKLNDLKKQNKIVVNRDRIEQYLEQFNLFDPPVTEETETITDSGEDTGDSSDLTGELSSGGGIGINMGGGGKEGDPLIGDITESIVEEMEKENSGENAGDNETTTNDSSSEETTPPDSTETEENASEEESTNTDNE